MSDMTTIYELHITDRFVVLDKNMLNNDAYWFDGFNCTARAHHVVSRTKGVRHTVTTARNELAFGYSLSKEASDNPEAVYLQIAKNLAERFAGDGIAFIIWITDGHDTYPNFFGQQELLSS